MEITYVLFGWLAVTAGLIYLQIFLSKREGKWPGLILPLITFSLSLVITAGILSYVATSTVQAIVAEYGEVIQGDLSRFIHPDSMILPAIRIFSICNIPTVVYLVIYIASRSRHKQRALAKMSVQDLG